MKRLPLIFLLGIAVISGCAKQPPALRLIPVTIAFQSWVGHGLFYLAQERGFCTDEGIELVFIDEQLDSDRRDAFKRGMLDFEAGTLDLLITKTAQGAPLAAVMELDQSSGADAIVATENIMKLEDLAGKKVALARNDVGETLLAALLYKYRLSLNSVTIVPGLPEEIAKIFLDGEADACVTWEPQISEALKRPGAHILASTKEDSGIIIATLNARRDLLENNPGLVKKVMRVWFKGLKYYKEHPLEASEIISKYYKITPGQYRKQSEGLKREDYEEQIKNAESKEWTGIFDLIADIKLADGRISQKPDASKCLNFTLLEKLYGDNQ
ncbi:MAG: ABC transporter substrate-binding protein [Candidatus Omnitrophica bacterium]|nr:ABC transporter substrate-binding protein [Candidatus Omnitrophota bacterium]